MSSIALFSAPNVPSKKLHDLQLITQLEINNRADYLLYLTPERLELRATNENINPVYVDFVAGKNRHRRLFGGGKGQTIAKAVGLNKKSNLTILDATAGLGRDAFVLACLGCKVTLLERSAIIYCLLKDGLERAKHDLEIASIIETMQLLHQDANTYIQQQTAHAFDVVYLDPMYPTRAKKSLVKKEMRFFHHVVGNDYANDRLLRSARMLANYRVSVKRPVKGDFITDISPDFQLADKNTRFDVYLPLKS